MLPFPLSHSFRIRNASLAFADFASTFCFVILSDFLKQLIHPEQDDKNTFLDSLLNSSLRSG